MPAARSRSICEIGMPCMRSMTITVAVHRSQYTSGTISSFESAKLRRSCEAFAASRIRSSSSCRYLANSATTSRGFRRLPSDQSFSSRLAKVSSRARSCLMTGSMFGRRILTATSWPPSSGFRRAKWTCAIEAQATGTASNSANTSLRRPAVGLLDFGQGEMRVEGRHAILQPGQFVGDVGRQQVAPGRQHLAELDEDRSQFLQRQAQPHRPWRRQVAPELHGIRAGGPGGRSARVRAPSRPARNGWRRWRS